MTAMLAKGLLWLCVVSACAAGIAAFTSCWLFTLDHWGFAFALAFGWFPSLVVAILSAGAAAYFAGAILLLFGLLRGRPLMADHSGVQMAAIKSQ